MHLLSKYDLLNLNAHAICTLDPESPFNGCLCYMIHFLIKVFTPENVRNGRSLFNRAHLLSSLINVFSINCLMCLKIGLYSITGRFFSPTIHSSCTSNVTLKYTITQESWTEFAYIYILVYCFYNLYHIIFFKRRFIRMHDSCQF